MMSLGIVFDLDGTLILSHHDFGRMQDAIVRTAENYGAVPGRLALGERIGTTQIRGAALWGLRAAGVSEGTILRFNTEVDRLIDEIEMEALPRTAAREGAGRLLTGLRDRRAHLGVLTRSSGRFCRAALERTGLAGFFPHVRTRSEPGPAKPSPVALHLLLREMDVTVERALFIGDHLEDAECATGAGVLFYGVLSDPEQPNPTTAQQFLAAGAADVAADLDEVARLIDVWV